MASVHSNYSILVLYGIILFIPCFIILTVFLYGICKRRALEWSMIKQHSKKQKLFLFLHATITLWYLSFITLHVLHSYFNATSLLLFTTSFSDDYISCILFIISAIQLQTSSTFRYDRYYSMNTKTTIILYFFYIVLLTVYILRRFVDEYANITGGLCLTVILLFMYLSYHLYYQPIQKLHILLEHYVDDIVLDKTKLDKYTDTLPRHKVVALVSGWIRETLHIVAPADVEQLCTNHLYRRGNRVPSIHSASTSMLSGLFSLSLSSMTSSNQSFLGQNVNRFTRNKMEEVLKKIFLYKLIATTTFGAVFVYFMRVMFAPDFNVNNTFVLVMIIVLYICIWIEIMCNCLLIPSNKEVYVKCCCLCRYWMNSHALKHVDIKYNRRKQLVGSMSVSTKWSIRTDSESQITINPYGNLRQSLSLSYTSPLMSYQRD
eukprot:276963_1